MPIKMSCACGWTLTVADALAGKSVKCPSCRHDVQIPQTEPSDDFGALALAEEPSQAGVERKYEELKAAAEAEPQSVQRLVAFGDLCNEQGRKTEAVQAYRAALRLDPSLTHLTARIEAVLGPQEPSELPKESQAAGSFATLYFDAFKFPLRGPGPFLLAAGAALPVLGFVLSLLMALLAILPLAGFFAGFIITAIVGFVVAGFASKTVLSIVYTTASGEADVPEVPTAALGTGRNIWDEARPILLMLGATLPCFAPAGIYGLATGRANAVFAGLGALSALLLPVSLLAMSVFEQPVHFGPSFLARTLSAMPMHYLLASATMAASLVVSFALFRLLGGVFVGSMIAYLALTYLALVNARITGCLYRANADRLEWF